MTSALEIWLKLRAEQDFPWMANTRARPTDLSQGSKTLTLQDRDPQAGKRSQYKLAQSLGPTSAGLTQIHLLPGDWRQRGSSPPPPRPHPGASFLQQAPPPPRESLSRQFSLPTPVGVVSDSWLGAALSQSPGTGHFYPDSELEGSSWPAVFPASRTWLSGRDSGELETLPVWGGKMGQDSRPERSPAWWPEQ